MVCSNKEAESAWLKGTPAMDLGHMNVVLKWTYFDRKKPPPPGGFLIYYVPLSRTVCKRTPFEGFVPGSSKRVLLHMVLDEGT